MERTSPGRYELPLRSGDQKLEDTKLTAMNTLHKKRKGAALPLTLIVLLVSGALVALLWPAIISCLPSIIAMI